MSATCHLSRRAPPPCCALRVAHPSSSIPAEAQATATLLAKAEGVLAGQALADLVLSQVDTALRAEWRARDGDTLHVGDEFCVIRGPGTRRASF